MKDKRKIFLVAIICLVLAVVGYRGYLFMMNGTVFSHQGNIKIYKAKGGSWEAFDGKYRLQEGDVLKTEAGADCSFIIGDMAKTMVKAGENTEVKVLAKNPAGLELVDGELMASITRPTTTKFTVKTPTGVCGMRGTGWNVATHGVDGTTISVYEGRVKFGENMSKYEREPYIIHDDDTLTIEKDSDAPATYKYKEITPARYEKWNKWMNESSKDLTKKVVVHQIVDGKFKEYPAWQEGMCYTSWMSEKYAAMESDISIAKMERDTNPSWINVVTTWYQTDVHSTTIRPLPDKTPSDKSIIHVFGKARELGMHLTLSTQLDVESGYQYGAWRGEIGFRNNEEWDKWFESYERYILHYAEIAEKHNVELFNIGTELAMTTMQRPDKWESLIDKVRTVYSGRITYTANWHEEYKEITFWNKLDYAGIAPYFPLAKNDDPSYNDIKASWSAIGKELDAWQKTHGKPVIFPEIGYKSCEGSAKVPWTHDPSGVLDLKQQYNCYKGALETFWNKEWFYGMYWWTWRTHPLMGGEGHRGFTPNDKPAAKLVNEWYAKPDPRKYKSPLALVGDKVKSLFGGAK